MNANQMSAEEERMLKLAIKNSLVEKQSSVKSLSMAIHNFDETQESAHTSSGTQSVLDEIEEVKTYRPTEQ
jgi:hypothetical protein